MFVFLGFNLLIFPFAWLSHPEPGGVARGLLVPSVEGGVSSDAVLLIIAIVGTTVAPWQLFFQQANVIDKRLTPAGWRTSGGPDSNGTKTVAKPLFGAS